MPGNFSLQGHGNSIRLPEITITPKKYANAEDEQKAKIDQRLRDDLKFCRENGSDGPGFHKLS